MEFTKMAKMQVLPLPCYHDLVCSYNDD